MSDFKFNPTYEKAYAGFDNLIKFLKNPKQQSIDAYHVAQDLWAPSAEALRQSSPLDPGLRPGVDPDALTPEQMELMRRRGLLGPGY